MSPVPRLSTSACAPRLNDGEISYETVATSSDQFNDCSRKTPACAPRKSDQDNSARRLHSRVDQLTKILVLSYHDTFASDRPFHDGFVLFPR
jgi:hypothetical protein